LPNRLLQLSLLCVPLLLDMPVLLLCPAAAAAAAAALSHHVCITWH
jgi:hypothetical protein